MTTDELMTEVERGEKSAMDENALREIKARANAATPGPWSAQTRLDSFGEYAAGPFHATGDCLRAMCDARFIADAREDVLRLLAEVNRLRSVLARCREVQKAAAERWRDEVADAAAIVSLVAAERDAARAEVERLRGALARIEALVWYEPQDDDDTVESVRAMVRERDEARAKAAAYERDWYEAKGEFGTAAAKLRDQVRTLEAALTTETRVALDYQKQRDEARAEVERLRAALAQAQRADE